MNFDHLDLDKLPLGDVAQAVIEGVEGGASHAPVGMTPEHLAELGAKALEREAPDACRALVMSGFIAIIELESGETLAPEVVAERARAVYDEASNDELHEVLAMLVRYVIERHRRRNGPRETVVHEVFRARRR